jgi:hypothetical protein
MSWDTNVYDTPEKYGLEIVDVLEDPDACWSFDTLLVLQHKETKRIYWTSDSGCSCPSPFEDQDSIESLEEVTDASWSEFQKAVEEHVIPDYYGRKEVAEWKAKNGAFQAEKTECLSKVARLLRENEGKA